MLSFATMMDARRPTPSDELPLGSRTSDYDYELPEERIAQRPVEPRDASRLLVLDRATGPSRTARFATWPS